MSQEIVKTFKELVTRLKNANIQGQLLERVKLIEGPEENTISDEDLPVIRYRLSNIGPIETAGFEKCVRALVTVELEVMTSADDGYYNDQRSGCLDYYEKILNVVDGNTAGSLSGDGSWGPEAPKYRQFPVERDGLKYQYSMEIELQSKKYQKGAL